jgi:transposase
VVYEAGPTGFALYRAARAAGVQIEVIAPSKTARPSGDRVKNDRKDAELLARLAMAGQLTAVAVPSEFVEAARHLSRTREQVRSDLMSARHRVSKLLLAHAASTGARRRGTARGATVANRQVGQPDHVLQIAWRAQHRLHRLHTRLRERGKPHNLTTVAMARELAGFLWAAATAP